MNLTRTSSTLLFLLCALLLARIAAAAEVDQYSSDYLPRDSRQALNSAVQNYLQQALIHANKPRPRGAPKKLSGLRYKSRGCDQNQLYQSLSWYLVTPVIGQLEQDAEEDENIDKQSLTLAQSIYRDFIWTESPSLVLSQRLAAVINIDQHLIGTDKLGHFFSEGFSYFNASDKLTGDIEKAFFFGRWSEAIYFGLETTGVFSYADLTANFNGLRFWNAILAQHPDPLTQLKPKAYFQCQNKRWQLVRQFDWRHYIDSAWDESINCSLFRDRQLLSKAQHNINAANKACRRDLLPTNKYQGLETRLLNSGGLRVADSSLLTENLLAQSAELEQAPLPAETLARLKQLRQAWQQWRLRLTAKAEEKKRAELQASRAE